MEITILKLPLYYTPNLNFSSLHPQMLTKNPTQSHIHVRLNLISIQPRTLTWWVDYLGPEFPEPRAEGSEANPSTWLYWDKSWMLGLPQSRGGWWGRLHQRRGWALDVVRMRQRRGSIRTVGAEGASSVNPRCSFFSSCCHLTGERGPCDLITASKINYFRLERNYIFFTISEGLW